MTITPFPAEHPTALGAQWRGFFYPLCLVSDLPGLPADVVLPVLSGNGLWRDDAFATAEASAHFTAFQLRDGQLTFAGDPRLFQGHQVVPMLWDQLVADWHQHHAHYLAATTPEQLLAPGSLPSLKTPEGFDTEYFLQTFRSFWYVREQYRRTGQFRSINSWLKGWREEPAVFFLPATHADFRSADAEVRANQAYLLPTLDLSALLPVGLAPAAPYFPDGNATLVYFDEARQRLVCVAHYC